MPDITRFAIRRAAVAAGVLAAVAAFDAGAADLPKSTQEFMKKANLPQSMLDGLDAELAVPQAWIDEARKAPVVKIGGSEEPPQHAEMVKAFLERYPFITIEFTRGSANERAVRPLVAFGEGRYIFDLIRSVDGSIGEFQRLDAVARLDDLPSYGSLPKNSIDPNHVSASFRQRPYCMAYNTSLIKKEQLPKTWADLPNTEALANGRVAATNLAYLWMMPLQVKYGEAWSQQYLDDFFTKLKPQIRQEGLNATMGLVASGENYISLPSYQERIKELQDKGAPIDFHCPSDAVPVQLSSFAILKGSPGFYAAKLHANWLISKEGQLAQYAAIGNAPIHKDLQGREFNVFPDEIAGRDLVSSNDVAANEAFNERWKKYATGAAK